jgi:hypothetical protein
MKKQKQKSSNSLSNFELFKLKNSKAIIGGTNDGGIIDPPVGPTVGGGRP